MTHCTARVELTSERCQVDAHAVPNRDVIRRRHSVELDLSIIDRTYEPPPFEYDWKQCATYALGVGAGHQDLKYLWEGSPDFFVLPSFAVLPTMPIVMRALRDIRADFRTLVHGAQTIRTHGLIPREGILRSTGRVSEVQDKGKGAVVIIETETSDDSGRPIVDTKWMIFCRGQGGFGGPRGESSEILKAIDSEKPLFQTTMKTSFEQALLYRLSGDLNPLHVDPALAEKVGFRAPILHGLCTYGFATRAIVEELCGGEPNRFRSFSARFSQEVYPGDSLEIKAFKTLEKNRFRLSATVGERTVLSNGLVEVY